MDIIKSVKVGHLVVRAHYDTDPQNPRTEYDNLCHMQCYHPRYHLGDPPFPRILDDTRQRIDDLVEGTADADVEMLQLYLYDHSGLSISAGSHNYPDARWDVSTVGVIIALRAEFKKEGVDWERRIEVMQQETETYDRYLRGEAYGYTIVEPCSMCGGKTDYCMHDTTIDSCWGFDDLEYMMEEATALAKRLVEQEEDD